MSKTYPKQLVCLGQVFVVNTKFGSLIMKGLEPRQDRIYNRLKVQMVYQ
jgi:hypothetical protein